MKRISRRRFLGSLLTIGAGTLLYGRFLEPYWLEVKHEKLKLRDQLLANPIRLLHLSDLHASRIIPFDFIDEAVELGLSYKPTLICITGDFITRDIPDFHRYKKILAKLPARAPTFASLGNHDGGIWAQSRGGQRDTVEVQRLLSESGITCLLNEEKVVAINNQNFTLVGLGDLWARQMRPEEALSHRSSSPDLPVILLSHNPDTKDYLPGYDWDLMLSGHTHGGQVRIPLVGAPYSPVQDTRYLAGLHTHNGKWLHITKGVGNVYGVRLNCRPQVSLIEMT